MCIYRYFFFFLTKEVKTVLSKCSAKLVNSVLHVTYFKLQGLRKKLFKPCQNYLFFLSGNSIKKFLWKNEVLSKSRLSRTQISTCEIVSELSGNTWRISHSMYYIKFGLSSKNKHLVLENHPTLSCKEKLIFKKSDPSHLRNFRERSSWKVHFITPNILCFMEIIEVFFAPRYWC